jgi:hypothetical protein
MDEPWLKELFANPCPTAAATSWLLTTGWRRGGLLAFDEIAPDRQRIFSGRSTETVPPRM